MSNLRNRSPNNLNTLVELLQQRAQYQADKHAYTFLTDGELAKDSFTYARLDQRARVIAAKLQSMIAASERVLLLYPNGLDYIAAFFACLYANVIAVPAYPLRRNRSDQRLSAIAADARATAVLTTADILAKTTARHLKYAPELEPLQWVATDALAESLAAEWRMPQINGDTLAFLQYTSGSTGNPKGVMVSHANLLHNLTDLDAGWGHADDSVMVTWLPIFHDMGLIYGILMPLYQGFPCYLMAPSAFLQQPFRWLQAISRYSGTHSAAPNFAYDLCVRRITPEQQAGLNLASWRMTLNGAEPVRQKSLRRFAETFAPRGFHPAALCPGYGLAEATLKVTAARYDEEPVFVNVNSEALARHQVIPARPEETAAQVITGCGRTEIDTEIKIVHPDTMQLCAMDQVGEIWVRGATVAQGYWGRDEETRATFQAYLASGEGPFMRTGDLGFFYKNELFITGRIKDIIIIRGLNFYPQDIEKTAEQSHPALRAGGCAAFATAADEEERLALIQEVERTALKTLDADEVFSAIRQAVSEQHDLQIHAIALIKPAALPKTSSGKVQRGICRKQFLANTLKSVAQWQTGDAAAPVPARTEAQDAGRSEKAIQTWLLDNLAARFQLDHIDPREPLARYGLDSVTAISLSGELETWLQRPLPPTLLYDYPNIAALAQHLGADLKQSESPSSVPSGTPAAPAEPIAVIGLGCRFPQADNPRAFLQLLREGRDAICEIPASRWDVQAFYHPDPNAPGKMNTRWGGFLEQADRFDPQFFGISPLEAKTMDPQQRLCLEVSWEALEHAGIVAEHLAGSRTGVFIGISSGDYTALQQRHGLVPDSYSGTGGAFSIAANRISYLWDLRGPSMAIDTACSSSLVAVHQACQSLRQGECDLALAGGVNLMLTPDLSIIFSRSGMMAADGRCKTFDARADGYVRGEGCGIVVLKPLSAAQRDGDNIFALIPGSAVNQDGRTNGLTAPNGLSQQALLRQALHSAGIEAAQIGCLEAHGTGTALGDPIEMNALKEVLLKNRPPEQPCRVGSVKTNIGHLEAAAGIAGLIKAVLALHHREIFPHLHFHSLNPLINLSDSPLRIPTQRQDWPAGTGRDQQNRAAGVSSFGFGGANAHLIVTQAPQPDDTGQTSAPGLREPSEHLFTLSAKSLEALRQLIEHYRDYLARNPETPIADLCYTVNAARSHFDFRLAVAAASTAQLHEQLTRCAELDSAQWPPQLAHIRFGKAGRTPPEIVFLFTGQGAQYLNMGRHLHETQPVFRHILEQCDAMLRPVLETPLLEVLYPQEQVDPENPLLDETRYTQPALFAIECALAGFWQSLGIRPAILIGHSIGEYAAACVAGVFPLEAGLKLVAERARLMQSLPVRGEMAVIFSDRERVGAALAPHRQTVSIAAYNEPGSVVISGETRAIRTLCAEFEAQGIETRPLRVSHAFHSPLMEPMLDDFARAAAQITCQKPVIPILSNLTGKFLEQAPDADYWRRHTRDPVRFMDGIHALFEAGYHTFLEVGPKPVLSKLGRDCRPESVSATWLPSLKPQQTGWRTLLASLSALYVQGAPIDWTALHAGHRRRRLSTLPTYAFQRQSYWVDMPQPSPAVSTSMALTKSSVTTMSNTTTLSLQENILAALRSQTAALLQIPPETLENDRPLLEMGADSLVIGQAVRKIETAFGVTFSIRQIFEEINTLDALAGYIAEHAPADRLLPYQPRAAAAPAEKNTEKLENNTLADSVSPAAAPDSALGQIVNQQLQLMSRQQEQQFQLMSRQLELLRGSGDSPPVPSAPVPPSARPRPTAAVAPASPKARTATQDRPSPQTLPPWQISEIRARGLSPRQQHYLEALIDRYTRRTPKSRQLTRQNRGVLADSRASAGFRLSTKEMLYPIYSERARGARTWDIDGNEYIDISMGFGVNLFGHHPPFSVEALQQQLEKTMQLGLQTPLTGKIANLVCELTGAERMAFCNTGTEAVMTALRLVRTATGRNKIIQFSTSYHGHFDGTLGEARDEPAESAIPAAPGVTPGAVADIRLLEYGDPRALQQIRTGAGELAGVLVEPVQSRRPDLQPKKFLQQLRQLTRELDIPLIFDEMITGFRVHQGGAQAWFGVQADLATYGKIAGGGMPIGLIAGKARYLDGIDGGMWDYGDASYPQADTTFFAGTFGKHPLAMAAALAVLEELKRQGPQLQERLNQRTAYLAQTLNAYFEQGKMPVHLVHFGSLFRFSYPGNLDLLYYQLLEKGIYVWEGRNCFLSTAHTDDDIERIIQAVKESVDALRDGGFFEPDDTDPGSRKPTQTTQERNAGARQPAPDYLLTPAAIQERLHPEMARLQQDSGMPAYRDIVAELERLSVAYVVGAFRKMDWPFEAGGRFSTAWLASRLKVIAPQHRLLNRLLEMLAEEGWLSFADEQWEVVRTPPHDAPRHQALLAKYPLAEAELTLLSRCGEQLAGVLRGECDPLQLLFPDGDAIAALYQTSPMARWFNTVAQRAVSEALSRLPDDRQVRILEVGAGTGGTTAYLLPHLPARQTVYVFSDLSSWFTAPAQKKFSDYPFVRYRLLDIEQAPQGIDLSGFDLVIAANVLHATEDLQRTVRHVQQLLAPGGLLILLEGTKKQRWRDLLLAGGFADVVAFAPGPEQTEQTVLIAEKSRRIPLIEAQKQLWALSKMEDVGARVAYNSHLSLQLNGSVNLPALRWAVQQVTDRHQALRTVFDPEGEFQCALSELAIDVPLVDCTESAQTDEIPASGFFEQESRQPFDLVHGPLIRVHLLKLAEQRHLLALTVHHIVSDGLSMALIANEIGMFYSARRRGVACPLDAPLQISDYIQWQLQQSLTPEMAAHKAFWLEVFSDAIPALQLPTDRPCPAIRTYQGGKQSLRLPAELYRDLKTFSRRQSCTPFMVLLAAYMTWLYRISGQNDLVAGVPVAGRNLEDGESVVGYCTHLLPVRTLIDGETVFTDYLQTLRGVLLRAYEHQDYPFASLIDQLNDQRHDQLNLRRDPSHPPLVAATFNLDKLSALPELSGLEVVWHSQPILYSAFDLSFNLIEFGEEVVLDCTYNTDVFLPATIARLVGGFRVLLEGIADNPARSLYRLPLLTEEETQQLIEWNRTETDYPKDKTIVDLFEEQVEKTPDNIATVFEGRQLTYAELNRQANQLAHALIALGVQADTLVGICVERSLEMIVGLLGILKAGGAYVPLDPDYPQERLHFMLEDSQAPVLLTQSCLRERLPQLSAKVVCLDGAEAYQKQPNGNPDRRGRPEDLAYVIYTSGSTGKPKGVMVGHLALTLHICAIQQSYAVQPQDRVLQFASTGFDTSLEQLLVTWFSGACSVPVKNNLVSAHELLNLLQNQKISIANLPPSYWRQMLDINATQATLPDLYTLILGGEALPWELARHTCDSFPSLNSFNAYGPTEAVITPALYRIPATLTDRGACVLIGQPRSNTQIHILDACCQPLPVGIPGELCIAGAGLARGYLNRPDLTAEKFIETKLFGKVQRICKTGDLARWLPDGCLEYLGRIDHQVKLRGFRIEPGEIEAVLSRHETVKEAVVNLHEREGSPSLAAYVVIDDSLTIDNYQLTTDLRDWLKTRLPDYMVPTSFTRLDKLPLTPNGKIDRKALPEPEVVSGTEQISPRTETEALLAALWSAVLKTEVTSTAAGFFDLGGHSLLATQLASRIRDSFGIDMPLRMLFEHPVLGDLAAWLDLQQRGDTLPPIIAQPRDTPLVLSYAQQRLWFLAQLEGPSAAYNMPAALKLNGLLNSEALRQTFLTLVERHQSLRLCFPEQNGKAAIRVIPVYDPFTVTDLSHLPEIEQQTELQRLIQTHAGQPFDLARGPLLRLCLLTLNDREQVLLFNMHHIISDGWSISVLIREWAAIYATLSQGRSLKHTDLEPLPIQYPDYAAWQRQWLQGEVLQRQLDYWTKQLSGAPELLELPTDFPRPAVQQHQAAAVALAIDTDLSARIKQVAQDNGCTLYMLLLAAFNLLLSRYSSQADILIGSPIANRPCHQTEGLIGLFLNNLILRADISRDGAFRDLLHQVRHTTLDAYAHQDIPFELLVEHLNPQRSLSYHPLFQVMLNLVNIEQSELSLPGLTIETIDQEDMGLAKFDLNLAIHETEAGLQGCLDYDANLFSEARMRVMAQQFVWLLQQIVTRPDAPLAHYTLLAPKAAEHLADPSQALPAPDYPLITNRFLHQVNTRPEAIAIRYGQAEWSYRTLCQFVRNIAWTLLEAGLQPGDAVALCGERSPEMIAGMMGVFLSGGVCLPLDVQLPLERRLMMLRTANVRYGTGIHYESSWMQKHCQIVTLRENVPEIPLPSLQPQQPAYIFFTSGTTGTPKAIMGTHAGLAHFIHWQAETFQVVPQDNIAHLTGISFDVVLRDIGLPLASGATLTIPEYDVVSDGPNLFNWLAEQHITLWHSVPSLLQGWLAALSGKHALPGLRHLFMAGEPLTKALLEQWQTRVDSPAQIINLYGPTETTLAKSFYSVTDPQAGIQPLGQALPDAQILILNRQQQCGLYEPGEIVIRTPFRTLGYLNTETPAFVSSPFRNDPDDLLYYSGDIGYYDINGVLHSQGRRDLQVKVRGVRIELEEISSLLNRHPNVRQSVVIASGEGEQRHLAAFAVSDQETSINEAELRRYLLDKLPDYMTPARFIWLDTLPLTPNGKIDRKALPDPDFLEPVEILAPQNEIESLLANLWSSVLKCEVNSVTAHFFELGGHSLLATQLASRIRDSFGIDMPLRILFEHPILGDLAIWLDQQQRGNALPPIESQAEGTALTLSHAQQRLWFIAQLEGSSATYNIPKALELRGRLDIQALEGTFTALVKRHQSLRLTFPETNGEAAVREIPAYNPLRIRDLKHLPEDEQNAEVKRLTKEHATQPFDLAQDPLLRLHLLTLGNKRSVLLFNMHHIISDAWSLDVLVREWVNIYTALSQGQSPDLKPLPVQYPDYAAWQRQWLQGEVLQRQLDYWTKQLNDAPELLELPADFPRPPVQSYRGARLQTALSPELTRQIKTLSLQQGSTLFMSLLAAFSILLHRYTRLDDILIGSPIACRTHSQTENLIGFFVNTLVLRTRIPGQASFTSLLKQVRQTALGAYAHQDIPFEYLVEQINPERTLSHSPLFQVMFVLQNNEESELSLPGLTLQPGEQENTIAKFDLTLNAGETDGQLALCWEYATDLFHAERIQRMAEHFAILLKGIVRQPAADIHALPLLTEAETQQLIEWNRTETDYPKDKTIVDLFEEQVEKTPDNIAAVFEGQKLTYAELNRQANQLAHALIALGVQADTLVGICVERSLEMVVGLLGILKAGGAYVPLDPDYPRERLHFMLEDSQAPVLLTQSCLRERLPKLKAEMVCLDDAEAYQKQPGGNPERRGGPENLAYVIYTSGSTGKPKGVCIPQQAVIRLVRNTDYQPFHSDERMAQASNTSFDAATYEIWGALLNGARLLYIPKQTLLNPSVFGEYLKSNFISNLFVTTALFNQIAQENPDAFGSLNYLLFGGEQVDPRWVAKILTTGAPHNLLHVYGPTESTTYTTWHPVAHVDAGAYTIPIGKPLANTAVFILDSRCRPLPIGIPGELCIAGAGLARGYLNRPDLTAEKFIEVELSGKVQRIYKTGDLARRLPDGNLEYLGRIDCQIKLRGFRIEPGEIEAVLSQHDVVKEAVVILHEREGNQFLAAYIVIDNCQLTIDLRDWLKTRLPDYMIPAGFTVLDKLPLTPNGKIDRKALPEPEAVSSAEQVAPRTETEVLLAALWSAVLKTEVTSTAASFFDLGGHSLLATRLATRIRNSFGVDMPLRVLFDYPVLRDLANYLDLQQPVIMNSPLQDDEREFEL